MKKRDKEKPRKEKMISFLYHLLTLKTLVVRNPKLSQTTAILCGRKFHRRYQKREPITASFFKRSKKQEAIILYETKQKSEKKNEI